MTELSDHVGTDQVFGLPSLEEVRAYVNIPASMVSDEDLARMYAAECAVQMRACRIPVDPDGVVEEWPVALGQALLRRTQRQIAGKNLPLGYIDPAGDYGPARIQHYDAMIEELEGPYRMVVFG